MEGHERDRKWLVQLALLGWQTCAHAETHLRRASALNVPL